MKRTPADLEEGEHVPGQLTLDEVLELEQRCDDEPADDDAPPDLGCEAGGA